MSTALNRFTQWLWPRGAHELPTASFPDFPSGFREPDTVAFSTAAAGSGRRARPRRVRGRGEEEARVDREFDAVIVSSDGGGLSGSESSDGSDWSVGWLEPLAPGLRTDGDPEDCYAVLVPCYRVEKNRSGVGRFLGGTPADRSLSDGKNKSSGFLRFRTDISDLF